MTRPVLVTFAASTSGFWRIDRMTPVIGEPLPTVEFLTVHEGEVEVAPGTIWGLRGVTSNTRYAERDEVNALIARQEGLARPEAICAALIPIRKSPAWWGLAQNERRDIFEETSHHTAIGLEYLPQVARRLHHGRDLNEPFDFLTWFEYTPQHASAFEDLVGRLRETEEWRYVEREVDIRLVRA